MFLCCTAPGARAPAYSAISSPMRCGRYHTLPERRDCEHQKPEGGFQRRQISRCQAVSVYPCTVRFVRSLLVKIEKVSDQSAQDASVSPQRP